MAYFEQLNEDKQERMNNALLVKIREQHDNAYQANLARAKTARAKQACAGRYEGSWWRLWNSWSSNQTTNLHIIDCLRADVVIGDTIGVRFSPAGRT